MKLDFKIFIMLIALSNIALAKVETKKQEDSKIKTNQTNIKEAESSVEELPHLPSDSATLNNLKQLFFKSRELKEKSQKYRKLVEELEKRIEICKKLAEQSELESDKIDKFIHAQLEKHQEVLEKIKAQTVTKYNIKKEENKNIEKFLAEVAKRHDDYTKTPEYKEKVNQYIRMMEKAKEEAEEKKKSLDDIKQPRPDPSSIF